MAKNTNYLFKLDLLLLSILKEKDKYGYEMIKEISQRTDNLIEAKHGTMYPIIYKLIEEEYITSNTVLVGNKARVYYHLEEKGKEYFEKLMFTYASQDVPLLFDFNVVIANLNKVSSNEAIKLIAQLRESIKISAKANEDYAIQYATIPLVGRTIFEQQKLLYNSLLEWLNNFEAQMSKE